MELKLIQENMMYIFKIKMITDLVELNIANYLILVVTPVNEILIMVS